MTQLACEAPPPISLFSKPLSHSSRWSCRVCWGKIPPPPIPSHQMWPSQVWWSLPGLTQRAPADAIVHNLAAQQAAGRRRMVGAFEEKSTEAKFVGIAGVYREKGTGRVEGGGMGVSSSLIKIFNTSLKSRFESMEAKRRWKSRPHRGDCVGFYALSKVESEEFIKTDLEDSALVKKKCQDFLLTIEVLKFLNVL